MSFRLAYDIAPAKILLALCFVPAKVLLLGRRVILVPRRPVKWSFLTNIVALLGIHSAIKELGNRESWRIPICVATGEKEN